MNYIKKDIATKEEYTTKEGEKKNKWHRIGDLVFDENGKCFGTIYIFGAKIKFSVFDKKEQE